MPSESVREADLENSLKKWKLTAVSLLLLLSLVATVWAVTRARNDPSRQGIQARDKETIRLQAEDGTTTEIKNIRGKTGAILQETVVRDKDGRVIDGGLRPGRLPDDTPGVPWDPKSIPAKFRDPNVKY
jgi:hypothetical protein